MNLFTFVLVEDVERSNDDVKYQVESCFSKLKSSVDPKGHVLRTLLLDKVITIRKSHEISKRMNQYERCCMLLDYLFEGIHPRSFILFRNSLLKYYNWMVAELDQVFIPKGKFCYSVA